MDEWQIYQLLDPRTKEPRYVGITVNPLAVRYAQHTTGAIKGERPLRLWVGALRAQGLKPLMRRLALFDGTKSEAESAERAWIALVEAKFADQPLLNVRRGTTRAVPSHADQFLHGRAGTQLRSPRQKPFSVPV